LLAVSILLQSFSFLSIKYASLATGWEMAVLLSTGFGFLVLRAVTWQNVLKRVPLSKVYPFMSLVQILIFLYAVFLFHEHVAWFHVAGLSLMLLGLYVLGKSAA